MGTPFRSTSRAGCIVEKSVLLSTPSCPCELLPKQNTLPLAAAMHVWLSPVPIARRPGVRTPVTNTGVPDEFSDPSPSWPDRLSPQHFIAPSESDAQV